jgi:hypothetical protein
MIIHSDKYILIIQNFYWLDLVITNYIILFIFLGIFIYNNIIRLMYFNILNNITSILSVFTLCLVIIIRLSRNEKLTTCEKILFGICIADLIFEIFEIIGSFNI